MKMTRHLAISEAERIVNAAEALNATAYIRLANNEISIRKNN